MNLGKYSTLLVNLDSRGVMTIALNRPEVRNAFNEVVIEELDRVFATDVLQPEVRAVVLKGQGPAFCAGGDLGWMQDNMTGQNRSANALRMGR